MKIILSLSILLGFSIEAMARDSSHLICAGYMQSASGPDNYGFAIQFDERRASDSENRLETLSTVWGGHLYQGKRLNKNDGFGQNGQIVLSSATNPKKYFFKGNYNLVQDANIDRTGLSLNGTVHLESSHSQTISTVLNCMDISN